MSTVKRNILLNPGPATTTDSVKWAQVVPDICPRERVFGDLMTRVSNELTCLAADLNDYTTVLFGGSGTAAVESILSTVVGSDAVVIINNGAYGKRMCEIAAAYGLDYLEFVSAPDAPVDIASLESFIQSSSRAISHLAAVHLETTTGLLTDITSIGKLCGEYQIDMIVDAMSSFAAVPISMKSMNISYLAASANKNMQGMPGISFCIANKHKLESVRMLQPRNYYLNLIAQYRYFSETGQMRFTPPVQTFYALEQAIEELKREGMEQRYLRYRTSWAVIIDRITAFGLKHLVSKEHHSGIVTAIVEPDCEGYDFHDMHDYLYAHGFTVYPGKLGVLKTFRIATMGDITFRDIEVFSSLLRQYLIRIHFLKEGAATAGISLRQNKYEKYKFMRESDTLSRHLPDTDIMSEQRLSDYLQTYGDVILKPTGGKRGSGVIRISEISWDRFEIHHESDKSIVEGREQLYEDVNRIIGERRYIVQQRIPLATVNDRPFDVRVIVQRKRKKRVWKVTGKAVKVAGEGYIVTNIERSNGTVLPIETAIQKSSIEGSLHETFESRINSVALQAASRLEKLFTQQNIFGFDMGLAGDGSVWIIEANLSPMLSHFQKLPSRKMYRRILRYKKS